MEVDSPIPSENTNSYLSDESSFYGDDEAVFDLEARVAEFSVARYWMGHERRVQRIGAVARSKVVEGEVVKKEDEEYQDGEETASDVDGDMDVDGKEDASTNSPTRTTKGAWKQATLTGSGGIAHTDQSEYTEPMTSEKFSHQRQMKKKSFQRSPTPSSNPQPSTPSSPPFNPRAGLLSSYQLFESLPEFLSRLPPSTTVLSSIGPWIYIHNPHSTFRPATVDIATLRTEGQIILSSHLETLRKIPGYSSSSGFSKSFYPKIKLLQSKLFALAKNTNVLTGKWLLFVPVQAVDRIWSIIAEDTLTGKLGCSAKVATEIDPSDPDSQPTTTTTSDSDKPRLICVYTINFNDKSDIKRVLQRLRKRGVVKDGRDKDHSLGKDSNNNKQIWYKPDVYTELGINSGNEWKIRASLYGSREEDML